MSLSAAERESLIRRYAGGPALLKSALQKAPPDSLRWRPGPGKWSVHEVVCHCADSETNAAMRLRYLLAEKDPVIAGYDQAAWAVALDYHRLPLQPALAAVEAVRANTVPLLEGLPEEAWTRRGTHTEGGRYGTEDWLKIYAEHLEKHSGQIERNLEAWRSRA